MNDTELYNLYDQIISTTVLNCLGEADKNEGICLKQFNPKDKAHLLFFEAAMITQVFYQIPVRLEMGLIDFYKFKWFYRRKRKGWDLQRYTKGELIDIPTILQYEADYYKQDMSIFGQIYDAFYGEGAK